MSNLLKTMQVARKRQKISQQVLGKRLGLPQSHISVIESEKVDPRLSSIEEMARALGLDIMLIPHKLTSVVKAMISDDKTFASKPRWLPDEEINDE